MLKNHQKLVNNRRIMIADTEIINTKLKKEKIMIIKINTNLIIKAKIITINQQGTIKIIITVKLVMAKITASKMTIIISQMTLTITITK